MALWGLLSLVGVHDQGAVATTRIRRIVEECDATTIILSLTGIHSMDVSYVMELLHLIVQWRCQRHVCLIDLEERDLRTNWEAAARWLRQPLFIWSGDNDQEFRLLGHYPRVGLRPVLITLLRATPGQWMSASEVAAHLNLSVDKAADKLKQLWLYGYIQQQIVTNTGNREAYVYRRIAPSV